MCVHFGADRFPNPVLNVWPNVLFFIFFLNDYFFNGIKENFEKIALKVGNEWN